jgi:hypothetical protein
MALARPLKRWFSGLANGAPPRSVEIVTVSLSLRNNDHGRPLVTRRHRTVKWVSLQSVRVLLGGLADRFLTDTLTLFALLDNIC